MLTIGFDVTILNVGLPTIATELSAGTGALQWIITAYVLVFAGLLLPCGVVGDRFGRKRLLLIGLVLLGAASLLAAVADGVGLVIGARAVMGLGAAMILPLSLAVVPVLFPEERDRRKAVALLILGVLVGLPLGPIIGGYLLSHFWWGSIFLINVPIVVISVVALAVLLPESRDSAPPRADLAGGFLSTAGLVSLVYGAIEAPERGWGEPLVLGALALGLLLIAAFVVWELRTPGPLIDLSLFRQGTFAWGSSVSILVGFAMFGLLFTLPQYLQFVIGADAFGTGLRLLPMIGGMIVGAPLGQRLAGRAGYRLPVSLGLLFMAGGLVLGATTETTSGYAFVAVWLVLIGLSLGLAMAPATDALLGALPPEHTGGGVALSQALRQAAGALGVALLGSLLAQTYADRVDATGLPPEAAGAARDSIAGGLAVASRLGDSGLAASAQEAFVDGMSLVLLACAAIAIIGAALTALFMPDRQGGAGSGGPPPPAQVETEQVAAVTHRHETS